MLDADKRQLYLSVILVLTFMIAPSIRCAPQTYYANIGSPATLTCGGGQYGCFSTYAYTNYAQQMIMIPMQSLKYQIVAGSITVNNVQATDAGFYTCSSNCQQVRYDQISYYLQPVANGQPVDTTQNFIPIPPFPQDGGSNIDRYYVVVNENLNQQRASVLTDGEIAGLVIGLFCAFLIVVAVITFLIILYRRKKQAREKNVDYSTIERDYGKNDGNDNNALSRDSTLANEKDLEKKSLTSNKRQDNIGEINTRNIKGPNVYKPSDLNQQLIDPLDLPNIDIGINQHIGGATHKTSSQRSIQNTPQINIPPGSYQNQLDAPYENQFQVPRPTRQDSSGGSSTKNSSVRGDPMLRMPPPPNRGPNKIQFPTKQGQNQPQQQQPRYISNDNIHLQQILTESGFITDEPKGQSRTPSSSQAPALGENPNLKQIFRESAFISTDSDAPQEDFTKRTPQGKTGYFGTRNLDSAPSPNNSYKNQQQQQPLQPQPRQKDFDSDGGGNVTVVSARTPNRNNNNNNNDNQQRVGGGLPPSSNRSQHTNRSYQQHHPSNTNNNNSNGRNQGNLSLSQRIETTTTPLQLPPLASLRANVGGVHFKDGATDV